MGQECLADSSNAHGQPKKVFIEKSAGDSCRAGRRSQAVSRFVGGPVDIDWRRVEGAWGSTCRIVHAVAGVTSQSPIGKIY